MLISSMALSQRAIGERWDVPLGEGVMWYWTLGVHLTEKNLDPGGAPLRDTNMQRIVCTSHAQPFNEKESGREGKHLFEPKQRDGGREPRRYHEFLNSWQNQRSGLISRFNGALCIQAEQRANTSVTSFS